MATENPTPVTIEQAKAALTSLKSRADALMARREPLLRDATIQEQNQERALQELKELGYPQAEGMDLKGLADLGNELLTQLEAGLATLTTAVEAAEAALGPEV